MSDITTRLRQTRADMIGTDDEQHYWDCHDAAAEIERLRTQPCPYVTGKTTRYCTLTPLTLTDEERGAIEAAAAFLSRRYPPAANTLRTLLERTK
jgi:hypothetical protein